MQSIRNSILRHLSLRMSCEQSFLALTKPSHRQLCASSSSSSQSSDPDHIMDRVIKLVKKFDNIDVAKVTETADFQKDLCLDSLDRVDLVMAFEQEFSVEIPDEKADKLTCCADVARYIASESGQKVGNM